MTSYDRQYREKLASWMIQNGFTTGHGDTFDDLLAELLRDIHELREERNYYRDRGA